MRLSAFEEWMVKSNLETIRVEGVSASTLATLRANGYDRVASAVIKGRLEYLRQCLRDECMSWAETSDLQDLAEYIESDDVELLEPAGVPEYPV